MNTANNSPNNTTIEEKNENPTSLSEWLASLKINGFLVNKYTWNRGTKRSRMFYLDAADNGRGGIDYNQAVIFWVKKGSTDPLADKRSHRMIYLKEITKVTKGKKTHTFEQGIGKSADAARCFSIHFKALTKQPKPKDSTNDNHNYNNTIEVKRTLDLEVETPLLCQQIVTFLKRAKKRNKKARQEARISASRYDMESQSTIGEDNNPLEEEKQLRKRPPPLQFTNNNNNNQEQQGQQQLQQQLQQQQLQQQQLQQQQLQQQQLQQQQLQQQQLQQQQLQQQQLQQQQQQQQQLQQQQLQQQQLQQQQLQQQQFDQTQKQQPKKQAPSTTGGKRNKKKI